MATPISNPGLRPRVSRFVAIGDSQTEGLRDYHDRGGLRGWADRFAERLAVHNPDLRYANLAVRGRRAGGVREEQLGPALELEPDLASVMAGINDVIRRNPDVDSVVRDIEAMYCALRTQGCTVLSCTFPVPSVGLARRFAPRLRTLNAAIREVAQRLGVLIVDLERVPAATDLRLYCPDRIHLNPEGHSRFAAACEATLYGEPYAHWIGSLEPQPPPNRGRKILDETAWFARYMVPKMIRTARGRSSGDGCTAKRPALEPIEALARARSGPTPESAPQRAPGATRQSQQRRD